MLGELIVNTVCAVGVSVTGYDVSGWQDDISIHARMAQAGRKFCFIKASEGHSIDRMFAKHWEAAKAAGMIVGAYDYFHPDQDPIAQAKLMESAIGKLGPGTLGPVIDWETTDGVPAGTDAAEGMKFLNDVQAATGRAPIIYGAPYFLHDLALDSSFAQFDLWIANYGVQCPLVPSPWSNWLFWQWTDSGDGGVDQDYFNGSLDELKKLAGM